MLNLNYDFCFSCFRESIITKFTKTIHKKTVYFSHILKPGLKLYFNLKNISSFFCEFIFTGMYRINETSSMTTVVNCQWLAKKQRCLEKVKKA